MIVSVSARTKQHNKKLQNISKINRLLICLVVQEVLTVAVRSSQFHFNLKNEKPKTMTIVKIIHMRQTWDPVTVELYVILCRNSDGDRDR